MIKDNNISCFIPCRAGSVRVPRKNITPIGPFKFGLLQIKLDQVLSCTKIDDVIISTNDDEILSYVYKLQKTNSNLIIDERADELCSSNTSTDELIEYVPSLVESGNILWTHVTSPFLTTSSYDLLITKYLSLGVGFDSLMTVSKIQNFLWNKSHPTNYNRDIEKWPRTQTLDPVYEVTSGAFIASLDKYSATHDRIGFRPYLYVSDKFESLDVDWPEDFEFVSNLIASGVRNV